MAIKLKRPQQIAVLREANRLVAETFVQLEEAIRPGMVFTIEPMINAGVAEWRLLDDGWTVVTADGALSAQFEHTIAITKDGPLILSQL